MDWTDLVGLVAAYMVWWVIIAVAAYYIGYAATTAVLTAFKRPPRPDLSEIDFDPDSPINPRRGR